MNKNKSPRIDGLTVEIFTQFLDILKTWFHKVVKSIQNEKQLSLSMIKGIISLFYKKKVLKRILKISGQSAF